VDTDYDAIVVGAGPAGSAAARDIAAHGFRTLLIEEHEVIGEPLHCAGLVTPRTLELAGVTDGLVINELRGGFVNSPLGTRLPLGGDRLRAVVIHRQRLDELLAAAAQRAGAELWTGARLVALERKPGTLALLVSRRRRPQALRTRLLIGADGAQSRVARWLGLRARHEERIVGLGVEASLDTERQDFLEIFVGNSIAPGFFGWVIPLGGGRARIGIATGDGRRPVHYLGSLLESFPRLFAGAQLGRLYGGVIPLMRPHRIYADNAMLVGDAAGQVKPTSGGGIYTGLVGAKHCAQVAVRALTDDDLSRASLALYQKAWGKQMSRELARGWDLRRIFLALDDRELDGLISVFRSQRLRRLAEQHGDIDFPSRLFSRLPLGVPIMRPFLRTALRLLGQRARHWKIPETEDSDEAPQG
jgi:digeranylgeranylglycerophospholipid reductase